MTYTELLQQNEWSQKCDKILTRDHYICQDCGLFGFHNGSIICLEDIKDLDSIFKQWSLMRLSPSAFFTNPPLKKYREVKETNLDVIKKNKNLYICEFNVLESANRKDLNIAIFEPISMSKIICEHEIKSSNAKYYQTDAVKHNNNEELRDWLYFVEFEKKLSDKIYLSIEYVYTYGVVASITAGYRHLAIYFPSTCTEIKGLNIHHTHYILRRMPWDYSNEHLITLCKDCHQKRHEQGSIPCYSSEGEQLGLLKPCDRCSGSGYLPQYKHVQNGICFKCGGEGSVIDD